MNERRKFLTQSAGLSALALAPASSSLAVPNAGAFLSQGNSGFFVFNSSEAISYFSGKEIARKEIPIELFDAVNSHASMLNTERHDLAKSSISQEQGILADTISETINNIFDYIPTAKAIGRTFLNNTENNEVAASFMVVDQTAPLEDHAKGLFCEPAPTGGFICPVNIWGTSYKVQFRGPHVHPLSPCINKTTPIVHYHLDIMDRNGLYILNSDGRPLVMHFALHWDGFRWRFIFTDASGKTTPPHCINLGFPSATEIFNVLIGLLLIAGIAYFAAYVIAEIVALAIIGSLWAFA